MAQLGDKVKDTISGVEGIVTGITRYLNGCVSVLVESAVQADGKTHSYWFDIQRLKVTKLGAFKTQDMSISVRTAHLAGGPVYAEAPTSPAT